MPIERLAVNASPLIVLFRSGQADILPALCPHVAEPDAVWREVTASWDKDAAASGLVKADWVKRLPPAPVDPVVQAWDLGAGESAVLSYVHAHKATRLYWMMLPPAVAPVP